MKLQPLMRAAILPLTSILLIIAVAALCPVRASAPQEDSTAENYVLRKVQEGGIASLDELPPDQRRLSASFIAKLLTGRDARLKTRGDVWIEAAVIYGDLNLVSQDIPGAVHLNFCTFKNKVHFAQSQFAKGLSFSYSTFDRRWAKLYRKVHIIIGSLFVPIGLAAWTGIIK